MKMAETQITITTRDIMEVLPDHLDQEVTDEVLERFVNYLQIDVPQWLIDNAKSFSRSQAYDQQVKENAKV